MPFNVLRAAAATLFFGCLMVPAPDGARDRLAGRDRGLQVLRA